MTKPTEPPAGRALAFLFATVVLISAFLLFQVQPLISKYILPWFGGGPTVWTTCLLFFQLALFAGYAYAHAIGRLSSRRAQFLIHGALLAAGVFLLPIVPDPSWRTTDSGDPTGRILALLAATVGVPYLALSATGPLLQAWFRDSFPGRSPYRLYALSNVGSLAALVTYPFLVEPALAVERQATAWSWGFGLFALLCALAAACSRGSTSNQAIGSEEAPAPGLSQWAAWLGLPALASVALLATTNHVCRDVAVVPFLWVAPLALYLLTFIIAFDHERWYLRKTFAAMLLPLAVLLSSLDLLPVWLSYDSELIVHFLGLFLICMIAHGELARLRPPPRYLTAFYLAIAAGGGLGGVLVTLIAPRVFDSYLEWPITLLAGFAMAFGLLWKQAKPRLRPLLGLAGLAALAILAHGQGWFSRELISGRMGAHYNEGYSCRYVSRVRGFFGVYTVLDRKHDKDHSLDDRTMFSGQVPHGMQLAREGSSHHPTTYFGPVSGAGRALEWYSKDYGQPRKVAVVGLGVGTLAAYARPGDAYRFYEINPDVERIARDSFTFLGECRGTVEVEIGDGRIALERDRDRKFDVLIIDAFSGDAIPAHLLTREAMELYLDRLAPDGAIAIHISNAYLDLAPVVRGLAEDAGMGTVRVWSSGKQSEGYYMADWYLLSKNPAFLEALRPFEWEDEEPRRVLHWTDARSNLFEILR